MPSSYSASARFTLQATGENTNTWGALLNTGGITLVDFAINGTVTISASGATTLTTANGSTDQARAATLNYTGATAGTLTIPAVSKVYQVRAATAACIVTNGSSSVTVAAGNFATVATDGTTVWIVGRSDYGGAKVTSIGAPTADTDASTKKYVDDTAFAAALGSLPGLTGNAGKALTVNAAADNVGWISILPAQSGKSGQFFRSLGADPTGSGPSGEWAYPINPAVTKTANYTAVNGDRIKVDTAASAFNITLPASPAAGDRIVLLDGNAGPLANGWATNTPTLLRNGQTIFGQADDYLLNVRGAAVAVVFRGGTWEIELGNA